MAEEGAQPSLEEVRWRIDAIDAQLHALIDERATLATVVAAAIEEALGRDGVAASLLADVGGLKLFALAGFYMDGDERLARAPGSLTGVIGAAPSPFDV